MAKRKNDLSAAEEYLNQVHYEQHKHSRRFTAKDPAEDPRWRFRILPARDQIPVPVKVLFILIVLGIAGFGVIKLYQNYASEGSSYALATLMAFVFLILIIVIAALDQKSKS